MPESSPRLLVLCWDPITASMAGPAIRAWHLALELARGAEVVLVGTRGASRQHPAFRVEGTDDAGRIRELVDWSDGVYAPTSVVARYPFIGRSNKPLCIDMYIPTHLENLELGGADPGEHATAVSHQVRVLNADLERGDFLLCASERQRDFWLGALGGLGRLNPTTYAQDPMFRSLIDVVPFGLDPSSAPEPSDALRRRFTVIGPDDPVLVWGGGVYNWFDPLSLVEAVARVAEHRPTIRLIFLGLRNPNPDIPEATMVTRLRALADELGVTGSNVLFNEGWVPYAERGEFLSGADIGVSTHLEHIETHFSFRTRVLDYLWAGLPTLLTGGDTLSESIAAAGLGTTVPPGDVDAIAAAMEGLLGSMPSRSAVREFGQRYAWSRVAEPLVAWAAALRPAADRVAVRPEPAVRVATVPTPPLNRADNDRQSRPDTFPGPVSASRIDQFVPTLAMHDAIGNHVIQLRRLLRQAGYRSDIYYEHVHPHLAGDTYDFGSCSASPEPDRTILYHASTHSDMTDWLINAASGGQRILVDYHNITPASYFSTWAPTAARSMELARRQLRLLAPSVSGALADSEYNAAELVDFGIDGAVAVPILLDLDEYHESPDPEAMTELDRHPLWLFVGRVAPNKCQHDVIAAFALYRRLYNPDARLALVGSSTSDRYLDALRTMIDELDLVDAVDLPGSAPFPTLLAYFNRADVFVCLSEHEGFCVPVIEAMELGVPVVAYAAAAVTETVADSGILLSDKDPLAVAAAVDALLTDQARCAALREAGRSRAAAFARERVGQLWIEHLGRLASS